MKEAAGADVIGERDTRVRELEVMGWLEVGAQRHPLPLHSTVNIGRSVEADVVLGDPTVSHRHAAIGQRDGGPAIWDCNSHNGTFADGVPVGSEGTGLRDGVVLHFGECRARFVAVGAEQRTRRLSRIRRYPVDGDLRIGRSEDNDIVLAEPNVSRYHAVLRAGPSRSVEDLGSRNGTWLGAEQVKAARLAPGDEIGIGSFRLALDRDVVTVSDRRAGIGLRGVSLCAKAGKETILHPTTLTVARGEVLALIGPSGSGKSTLLRLLAGVSSPYAGETTVDGEPVAARLPDLGYVPQHDAIHDRLEVREALSCAAALRLPADTTQAEIDRHVEAVMEELELVDCAERRIESISGGQRKRAACGVELIGRPSIFLLDEPTSGLDPPLERQFMETVRGLADDGKGVVITTHATSSLSLCDSLAIMAPGGHLAFTGAPQDALDRYDVRHYDELYTAAQPTAELESEEAPPSRVRPVTEKRVASDRSLGRQLAVLTTRYLRTFWRDRRTVRVLFGQVPLIAVLIAALFPSGLLSWPDAEPTKSAQFAFLLVTASLWIGLIDSCREIVNERPIVLREFAVGSRIRAYLGAKVAVLFSLAVPQVGVLLAVSMLLQPLHQPASAYVDLYFVLLATTWAAMAMGLAVSTLARSVDQATSFVPILLIPQLLFAGALVTVSSMQPGIRLLSDFIVARWAFAGAGSSIEMNARLAGDPGAAHSYGHAFFAIPPPAAIGAVLLFVLIGLASAAWFLSRRVA